MWQMPTPCPSRRAGTRTGIPERHERHERHERQTGEPADRQPPGGPSRPKLPPVGRVGQNAGMALHRCPPGIRRRSCLLALPGIGVPAWAADTPLRQAMQRAEALRDAALRAGDQAYGAVVLRDGQIVGAAPSRVVTATDPTAHAEMEALRDAARQLRTHDLSGCVLVSTSRPCRMCEAAAAWAGIARMVYGESLTDLGAPR